MLLPARTVGRTQWGEQRDECGVLRLQGAQDLLAGSVNPPATVHVPIERRLGAGPHTLW
ncbi:MAG: hypothetical protein WCJ55_18075 [Chloroflexales bacterium]